MGEGNSPEPLDKLRLLAEYVERDDHNSVHLHLYVISRGVRVRGWAYRATPDPQLPDGREFYTYEFAWSELRDAPLAYLHDRVELVANEALKLAHAAHVAGEDGQETVASVP